MMLPTSREFPPHQRLRMDIELSSICNFKCPICPHAYKGKERARLTLGAPFTRPGRFIEPEVFRRAVEEANRVAEVVEIGFFGEQTLHRRYHEYVRALKTRRFRLETNTNLSRVTQKTFETWMEAEMDLLRLSSDAITPEVFNRARPGSVHDMNGNRVDEADRMAAINEKIHAWLAIPNHRPTRIVFVRSSHNRGEEEPFIDYWQPFLGPNDCILVKQVLTYGGVVDDSEVLAHRCNVWEQRYLMVAVNGDVTPCNLDVNIQLHLGNIMDDSIENLYNGPIARWLRLRTGCGNDLTPCRTCVDGNNWSKNRRINPLPAAQRAPSTGFSMPPASVLMRR
ncbi:MAG: radical SAM protein [Myxococcota bacterium]